MDLGRFRGFSLSRCAARFGTCDHDLITPSSDWFYTGPTTTDAKATPCHTRFGPSVNNFPCEQAHRPNAVGPYSRPADDLNPSVVTVAKIVAMLLIGSILVLGIFFVMTLRFSTLQQLLLQPPCRRRSGRHRPQR